jgi:hypothetical protein
MWTMRTFNLIEFLAVVIPSDFTGLLLPPQMFALSL